MTEHSPRLNLPFIQQAQAQKHITHNEAIERLDLLVQLVVEGFAADTPPVLPQEGQIWALGAEPSGVWAGQGNMLAAWAGGGWLFLPPAEGWLATSASALRVWNGTSWVAPLFSDLQNVPGLGVNTSYDTTNRLAVAASATLLTHDGADHQLKINKSAEDDTASLLFQTGWSGRAEMGAIGDDDFTLKVSADGVTWRTGLTLDAGTGNAVMQQVEASSLTGTAVTQSDTDTTAGRVMRTGHRVYPTVISAASDTGTVNTQQSRAVIASSNSRASGAGSLVAACTNYLPDSQNTVVTGISSAAISCQGVQVSGNISGAFASQKTSVLGAASATIACYNAEASGNFGCATLAAGSSTGRVIVAADNAVAMCGRRFVNAHDRSLALGDAGTGAPSTANRTIHLFSSSGNIQIAGSLTSSHTFSDFAEMFPNATGAEIPLGTIVAESGGAVRPGGPGDEVAGVVTATAVVTAGDTPFAWQGRYLSDEWGQPVTEMIPDPDHEGNGPAPLIEARKENPAWDPALPQTPRSQRPADWTRVGLLGQVFTRVAGDVVPGDRLSALDGIGVKSINRTGLRCMKITQPYDAATGYAVAQCLINIRV